MTVALALAQPALAQPGPVVLVQAEAQRLAPVCGGRDLRIEGNHNAIRPIGICRSLLLKGVANDVTLALSDPATIRVEGSDNHVVYAAAAPIAAIVLGPDNGVARAGAVIEQAPGVALDLRGDDLAQALDCAGRDVTIEGARSLYVLRGGCRSLGVQGALVTVQAELLPGAPLTITGQGVRVGWVLVRRGGPPVVSIAGKANAAERLAR